MREPPLKPMNWLLFIFFFKFKLCDIEIWCHNVSVDHRSNFRFLNPIQYFMKKILKHSVNKTIMILFCFLLSSLMRLEFIWTIFNIKQQFQLLFSFEGWGKEIIIWTLNGVKQKKGVLRIFWGNYFLHFLKSLKNIFVFQFIKHYMRIYGVS